MSLRSPSPIDERLLAPLGRVIANFSVLDWHVGLLVWFIHRPENPTPGLLTADRTFGGVLAKLYEVYHAQNRFRGDAAFGELWTKLGEAKLERNRLLHSVWMFRQPPSREQPIGADVITFGGGWSISSIKLVAEDVWTEGYDTPESLLKFADDIADLAGEVTEFRRAIGLGM